MNYFSKDNPKDARIKASSRLRHLVLFGMLLFSGGMDANAGTVVNVSDFGAFPDDGVCDAEGIRAAVDSVSGLSNVKILFDAGVYNLDESAVSNRSGRLAMVHLWNLNDWVVEGAVDANGDPATTLEMNLHLQNEVTGARHLDIRSCDRFEVRNLIIDQNPRMATASEVIEVNRNTGVVKIEMLEGMAHFDGMASFSANNWDLSTGLLIPGPAVTIGTSASAFEEWAAVDGSPGSYTIQSSEIADIVSVGEGLSFHFNLVIPQGRSIDAYKCHDIVFENIFVYNSIGMVMGAGDNRNMTFKRFHVKPEGNSLAVGPRDGIHISRSTGRLLMEDVLIRGVRWDPIVSYHWSAPITERVSHQSVRLDTTDGKSRLIFDVLNVGSDVHFWTGDDPTVRVVSGLNEGVIEFSEPLDPSVQAGGYITPGEWIWEEAVIRKSKIESNYGTALVYESDNLLVENCIFNNNAYSNIGLGATSSGVGLFTRNIVIRNNLFQNSTWEPKYTGYLKEHRGTITLFNIHSSFSTQQYHRNILIEGNLFKDLTGSNSPAAIDIKLAENVTVRGNRYVNVASDIYVDSATTANVNLEGLGIARNFMGSHPVESIPEYLDKHQLVRFERGANAPVPAFEFTVDRPVTVYIAVHDRGEPTIPGNWELQADKINWRTSPHSKLTDSIYRADFASGQVLIPGHDGKSGDYYGVPHMLFVASQDDENFSLSPASFTYPTSPEIQELDLLLYWSGDSKTPFEWALESGFEEWSGSELSMFESYLLNRRDKEKPFSIRDLELPGTGSVTLSWLSDGLPNGKATVRASPDLTSPAPSDWFVLNGSLSHDGQQTIFNGGSYPPDADRMFFRVEVSE